MSRLSSAALAVLLIGGLAACEQRGSDPANVSGVRAVDRAAGTNMSGAYPSQSDGTRNNPSGTAAERALDTNPPTRRNPSNPGL
jgi:hypothetical protein